MQVSESLERAWELSRGQIPERARGLVRAALWVRLLLSRDPAYADAAYIGGLIGLLASRRMRLAATAAVEALGARPTRQAAWKLARAWWYQRAADGALGFQADRLTPAWVERHIAAPAPLHGDGCVLLSVHHFNQRLGFARLSMAVENLGAVSMFEPDLAGDLDLPTTRHSVSAGGRQRARSILANRIFGERIYLPPFGARRGLELLQRGGSLIVLSDFLGGELGCVLGRQIPVPSGALWFAQQSGRPIVPFVLSPPRWQSHPWHLWCGEPIQSTRLALVAAVEDCIRRSPTGWTGWPAWHEAPVCTTPGHPGACIGTKVPPVPP